MEGMVHLKTKPYPFQKEDIQRIREFEGRCLIANEMGTGKTLEVLAYIAKYMKGRQGPILVVCPANLKYMWQEQALEHIGMKANVIDSPPKKYQTLSNLEDMYIINYERLPKWLPLLMKLRLELIIIDECHYIQNRKAQRTKNTRKIARNIKKRLALSGTPITKRPADLYPVINIIKPKLFPDFLKYAQEYCDLRRGRFGWEYKGATNLKKLNRILTKHMMIRRTKAEVLKDLPKFARHVLPIHFDAATMKNYNNMLRGFIIAAAMSGSDKFAIRAKLNVLKHKVAELKLKQVFEWIDNFLAESDRKLIVFGIHRSVLGPLHERYKDISVKVDGKITGDKRHNAIRRFKNSKECRLFFGNIIAAGTGWNGTCASTVLMVEMEWNPGNNTQAEARPHRIGQKFNVESYYLIAKDTVEEIICSMNQRKQGIVNQVLGGSYIDDFKVMDMVTQALLKGKGYATKEETTTEKVRIQRHGESEHSRNSKPHKKQLSRILFRTRDEHEGGNDKVHARVHSDKEPRRPSTEGRHRIRWVTKED